MLATLKSRLLAGTVVLALAACVATANGPEQAANPAASPLRVDNFDLADQDYFARQLYYFSDAKAVVLFTHASGDAAVAKDAPALMALKSAYGQKGVEFLALNSRLGETRARVKQDMQATGLDIPVLFDYDQLVGEQLQVKRAAETIVINPKTWQVAYRGPVSGAKDAIDAVSGGRAVAIGTGPVRGAEINFAARSQNPAKISYVTDIAPIIQAKCTTCHEPGGVGPMPLTSYEMVKGFAPMIREVIRTNRMPPDTADPTVGHFRDDWRLTGDQKKTLVHWIEAGASRGEGEDPLAKIKFQAPEWPLGKPDLIVTIPEAKVQANGLMPYQYPVVADAFPEDRWLRAASYKFSDRRAVHHVITSATPKSEKTSAALSGIQLGGFVPGRHSSVGYENSGVLVPAHSSVLFQNHYAPYGRETSVKTEVGYYFYPKGEPPKYRKRLFGIFDFNLEIPAGAEHHTEIAYAPFPKDALLTAITPHAHSRGAAATVSLRYPDGHEDLLLAVPRYDFNWQHDYHLVEPIPVPAGSKLVARWVYNNSPRNKANPDPTRTIPWGEQTTEEMLAVYAHFRWVGETVENPLNEYDRLMQAGTMMGVLDTSLDGKLQESELTGPVGSRMKPTFAALDKDKDGALSQEEMPGGRLMPPASTAGTATSPAKSGGQ